MYNRGTDGKSALSLFEAPSRAIIAVLGSESMRGGNRGSSGGRLPFARRIESRTFALPKDGDRCRLIGTLSGTGNRGTAGTGGSCEGGGGIWDGSRPDCAKKDKAVIHSSWRSCEMVVNFSARAGVRMRIERWNADLSSGFLGKGVSS
jgi:hypothetical protein